MDFECHNPTRLIFGAGCLSRLGEVASGLGKRTLLVTGGGSVKHRRCVPETWSGSHRMKSTGMAPRRPRP